MMPNRIGAATLLILLAAACAASPHEPTDARPVVANLHLERLELTNLNSDSAEFELSFAGAALKSVSLQSIFFTQLLVNGMPLHATPIHQILKLKQGREIENFPKVSAHIAFREVDSLQPLREMVASGRAQIHASVLVQLELNPFEILALRALDAWAALTVDSEEPVELPGAMLGKAAAYAALTAAEPIWVVNNEAREWRRQHSTFGQDAKKRMGMHLVSIDCSYAIRSKDGANTELTNRAVGFQLPSGRILTTGEAVEPWSFDTNIAEALSHHQVSLVNGSVDVLVRYADSQREFSSLRNEVRILDSRHRGKLVVSSDREQPSYRLQFRNTNENLAVLELTQASPNAFNEQPVDISGDPGWRPAAVFYKAPEIVVFVTEVKSENGRLMFKEQVTPEAFGSPVLVENGVAGIVQDQDSAADVRALGKAAPAEKF